MKLLDANVFITAQLQYYPLERVPEFWDWIIYHAEQGNLKVPIEVYEEVTPHDDGLKEWLRLHREELLLPPGEYDALLPDVLERYAPDLDEDEIESLGRDPYLVAAALHHGAVVVSKEVSAPRKIRSNRKVPDVCADLGVECINDHQLIVDLDFSTNWRARLR